jgi:exonuclease III
MAALLLCPATAAAQNSSVFKVAYYNIKSGKGQVGLHGPVSFADTANCSDATRPLNAWGIGFVQQHLLASVGADPDIVALGLGEAWACGSPENVRRVLGWRSRSSERNGVAMVARYGFAGPEQWVQLDTSQNPNPADTKWVLRQDVCLDPACSEAMPVFVAHWYAAAGTNRNAILDRQAQQTVEFLLRAAGRRPHVFVGDLNVWEGTGAICADSANNTSLQPLRAAGYVDAWPWLHGGAEGYTGMLNRNGCGTPQGSAWKRIDYVWSPASLLPIAMTRFGVVAAGVEAPSDHYGIIATFPRPGSYTPPPAAPGCASPDPFVALGGGTCVTGGWLPPGMPPPAGGGEPAPAPPAPAPAPPMPGCASPDPFVVLGGGTCVNGGWLPPGIPPPAGRGQPAPAPPMPGPAPGCASPDPFVALGGGTCVNGGWLPPGMRPASSTTTR